MNNRFARIAQVAIPFGLILAFSGCGISVSVGDESDLASSSSSSNRNTMQTQADWRRYIDQASPKARPRALVDLINSSTGYYLRYGLQIADNWYKEEQKRGQQVPLEEIKVVIDKGAESQQSLLNAHREMIRYAMQRIHDDQYLDDNLMVSVQEYVSHYRLVYEEVFSPTADTDDLYKEKLIELRASGETRSEQLKATLENRR